jgi:hypothetical protein
MTLLCNRLQNDGHQEEEVLYVGYFGVIFILAILAGQVQSANFITPKF